MLNFHSLAAANKVKMQLPVLQEYCTKAEIPTGHLLQLDECGLKLYLLLEGAICEYHEKFLPIPLEYFWDNHSTYI